MSYVEELESDLNMSIEAAVRESPDSIGAPEVLLAVRVCPGSIYSLIVASKTFSSFRT